MNPKKAKKVYGFRPVTKATPAPEEVKEETTTEAVEEGAKPGDKRTPDLGETPYVVYSFDTTGSMQPCLADVRIKLKELVIQMFKDIPGIKIGIVTRNSRAGVAISMEKCGIMADALVTRDDVENTKPHPDHILRALDSLGVSSSEAVIVGDHWMDVLGGKSAGTRTIGFLRPDRPDDFFDREKPDLVIRDLAELLAEIERLKE